MEAALRSGVTGWVRNTEDGRVEVHVQGPAGTVEEFERWLEKGPRWARVDALSARNLEADASLEGFEIRW
jgi:acylphosphatase